MPYEEERREQEESRERARREQGESRERAGRNGFIRGFVFVFNLVLKYIQRWSMCGVWGKGRLINH